MKHIIINVGRQLGSGGHDIGRMLALDFQAKYYDREILNLAAKESGLSEKIFEQNDEKKGFFRGLLNLGMPHLGGGSDKPGFTQESLFQFQSEAIQKAAKEGSCVFVGRCADYVLRDFSNVVNIFITASIGYRIEQIMNKQHLDFDAAQKFIEQKESCKCVGAWKVYGDVERAQKRFTQFEKCTAAYCRLYRSGKSIERLTVQS